jgi:hypothetical protein
MSLARQSIFTQPRTSLDYFQDEINRYCASIGAADLALSEKELEQLEWLMATSFVTPEARAQNSADPLVFEIKRAIARRYSFELLIKGDEGSYQKFIAQQPEPKLAKEDFEKLSTEARNLSDDEKSVIRLGCLLTTTDKARRLLMERNPSNDSEEFLTQLATWLDADFNVQSLFPIAQGLTAVQTEMLTKMYWPNTHLRHMLQTEGGDNMTASLQAGIAQGDFTLQDFTVLKWRWLTVAFGFAAGSGAKYYNADIHYLTSLVNSELEKCFTVAGYSYLDGYLLQRAARAGLRNGDAELLDKYFFGHLVAFSNQVHVMNEDQGAIVFEAYIRAQQQMLDHEEKLAISYHRIRKNPAAVTPTYVTSVYSTAYDLVLNQRLADGKTREVAAAGALHESTQFICCILNNLYKHSPVQRISLADLAQKPKLTSVLAAWQQNHDSLEFKLTPDYKMDVTFREVRATHRMI